jgi:hypothetical protein
MTQLSNSSQHTQWIPLPKISVVWSESQRGLDPRKVKHIAEGFDPDALGAIIVTKAAEDGTYHCIDGQHRIAAVRTVLGRDQSVPCIVVDAADPKSAAKLWLIINGDRTKPTAIERFHRGVTAGNKPETEISNLVKSLGWSVSAATSDGTIRAVGACLSVYRRYGYNMIRDVLIIIKKVWGHDANAVDAIIIQGMALFLSVHADAIDKDRLVAQLQKKQTPLRLTGSAHSAKEIRRRGLPDSAAYCITNCYNIGLSDTSRLKW